MELLLTINGYLYYPILIIVLLGAGLYFTIRTGCGGNHKRLE